MGYTLKLKVALRLSEINPAKSQAIITSISTDPTFNGFIMSASEEAKISFSTSGGSQNPLYSEIVGVGNTQNIYGSKTCIDSLNSNFDPRAYIFYNPTASGVVGIAQGDFNNAATAAGKSIASHYVGAEANNDESGAAPVKFISVYESLFLQAEATARGWLIGAGTDQELFEAGIAESFKAYLTDADVEEIIRDSLPGELNEFVVNLDYAIYRYIHGDTVTGYLGGDTVANTNLPATNWGSYPAAGTTQEKIRHIVTQKWFSMCGNQGFEAWTEWRRTGYPDFLVTSVNSLIGASKPVRFIYPTEEINLNANFPGVKQVTQKMWWDAN
ncbi:MAG: SusD/RagB family nutrient-binding outer membrane lipoprotein [Bacteroidetes bacterium]|nr:SusD/RagB family nutrient-binding outer membrane lipoprotein [Bacteroidota bacterium]